MIENLYRAQKMYHFLHDTGIFDDGYYLRHKVKRPIYRYKKGRRYRHGTNNYSIVESGNTADWSRMDHTGYDSGLWAMKGGRLFRTGLEGYKNISTKISKEDMQELLKGTRKSAYWCPGIFDYYKCGLRPTASYAHMRKISRARLMRPYRAMGVDPRGFCRTSDVAMSDTAIANTWALGKLDPAGQLTLFSPNLGTGNEDRSGDRVRVTGVAFRFQMRMKHIADQDDVADPVAVKLAIVLDKQTNNAQLGGNYVYQDNGPGNARFTGFRNMDYKNRFRILWSQVYEFNTTAAFTDGANTGSITGQVRTGDIFRKANFNVTFSGNAGTIADIVDNSLHVLGTASVSAGTVHIDYFARTYFYDDY